MTTPDIPHRFEFELTVSATPEQVWDAIASADGISAWMLRTELDPRVGGAVKFHMGPDGASEGTVTAFVSVMPPPVMCAIPFTSPRPNSGRTTGR